MKPHLITGATGALGRALAQVVTRLGRTHEVLLGARRPELLDSAFSTRRVDYDDVEGLREAFRGIGTLVLVSSNGPDEARVIQHRQAIDAARAVGVERIVYTSFIGADSTSTASVVDVHRRTEAHLRSAGVPWVALRNGVYLDGLPQLLAGYEATGVVAHPTGTAGVAWITRSDIASFTADVLFDPSVRNEAIPVVPPTTVSMPEIVAMLARHTGFDVAYHQPTDEAYVQGLVGFGLPEPAARTFAEICRAIREGTFDLANEGFAARLGAPPLGVESFIRATFPARG